MIFHIESEDLEWDRVKALRKHRMQLSYLSSVLEIRHQRSCRLSDFLLSSSTEATSVNKTIFV